MTPPFEHDDEPPVKSNVVAFTRSEDFSISAVVTSLCDNVEALQRGGLARDPVIDDLGRAIMRLARLAAGEIRA